MRRYPLNSYLRPSLFPDDSYVNMEKLGGGTRDYLISLFYLNLNLLLLGLFRLGKGDLEDTVFIAGLDLITLDFLG